MRSTNASTNEEIAAVLRKLQSWRKELKALLQTITPNYNIPPELIANILGFVGFDPPREFSQEERRLTRRNGRHTIRLIVNYCSPFPPLSPLIEWLSKRRGRP